jgi:hypothetical protein
MAGELPALLKLYERSNCEYDPSGLLKFWCENCQRAPAWVEAARIFVLCQPSSGAAERGFSVWRTTITDQQTTTLEDRQKLTVQLAYSREIE